MKYDVKGSRIKKVKDGVPLLITLRFFPYNNNKNSTLQRTYRDISMGNQMAVAAEDIIYQTQFDRENCGAISHVHMRLSVLFEAI